MATTQSTTSFSTVPSVGDGGGSSSSSSSSSSVRATTTAAISLLLPSIMANLIFEKATNEPLFCITYAKLSADLAEDLHQINPSAERSFRRLLLNRCQKEFETNLISSSSSPPPSPPPPPVDPCSSDQQAEQAHKRHRTNRGTIQFISELFKHQVINEKIAQQCLRELFASKTKEQFENFCLLMTNIGQQLDHGKSSRPSMDHYFENLHQQLVAMQQQQQQQQQPLQPLQQEQQKQQDMRMRFMIQDLIDLRENDWLPRRHRTPVRGVEV